MSIFRYLAIAGLALVAGILGSLMWAVIERSLHAFALGQLVFMVGCVLAVFVLGRRWGLRSRPVREETGDPVERDSVQSLGCRTTTYSTPRRVFRFLLFWLLVASVIVLSYFGSWIARAAYWDLFLTLPEEAAQQRKQKPPMLPQSRWSNPAQCAIIEPMDLEIMTMATEGPLRVVTAKRGIRGRAQRDDFLRFDVSYLPPAGDPTSQAAWQKSNVELIEAGKEKTTGKLLAGWSPALIQPHYGKGWYILRLRVIGATGPSTECYTRVYLESLPKQ